MTVSCEKVPLLAPTSASITLTALATALPINGTTDLLVQVLEQAGTPPHSGTHVTFTATLGTVQPSEAETDINGRVVVKFLAGTASGTATITASSGGAGSSGGSTTGTGTTATDSRTVKIAIGAAAVARIAVSATPGTVPAAGGSTTIVANVGDANGNPLAGVPVTFTTDAGSLSAAVVNSDQSGNAQTTLTTSKQAKVTAAAGLSASGSGTTATGVTPATVTVNVNAPAAITIGTQTPSAPSAGQNVSWALTYSTANVSPIARVIVDWGDGSAAQTFTGAPSAVSHVFSSAGAYLVRITGVDTFGDTSSSSTSVTVAIRPQPTLTIAVTPASPTAGQVTSFTVTATAATGTTIQNVALDFGDGVRQDLGAASGANTVQHVYASAGTYAVTATASDSNGGRASTSTVIVVTGSAGLSVNLAASPASALTTTFTATVTPSPTSATYSWNFDTATATTTGNAIIHTFGTCGCTKTVTVSVTSNTGQTGSTSMSFVVP